MYLIEGKLYPCSTSLTMRFIGGKWKAVILVHLMKGSRRYSEIRSLIPTITERTLSLQLKQLESDGLIKRIVLGEKQPLKVIYELTAFGRTLIPLLKQIALWGNQVGKDDLKVKIITTSAPSTKEKTV